LVKRLPLVFPKTNHNQFITVHFWYVPISMCLAIPGKIKSIKDDKAQVDFGEKVLREVNITLVDARVGDYVLVHAGYAIQVLDEKEAQETLDLWNQILEAETQQR
jgi:hydrogenase expression/formation protein HypC